MKISYLIFFVLLEMTVPIMGYAQVTDSLTNSSSLTTSKRCILVINSFDAMSLKLRNNKKELFTLLADSLKIYLEKEVVRQTAIKAKVIPGILSKSQNLDSNIFLLMKNNNASHAILIWSLDAYFEQAGSRETEDSDGKTRNMVSYDLCAKNEYTLYSADKILKQSLVDNCNFFTERTVTGKRIIIAIGPDIVGKKKHTYGAVANNANRYIAQVSSIINESSGSGQ